MTASARRSLRIAAGLRTVPLRRSTLRMIASLPRTAREIAADLHVTVADVQPQISSLVSSELIDYAPGYGSPRLWAITTAGRVAIRAMRGERGTL